MSLLTTGDGTPPNLGDACCVASAILFGVHKFRSESITGRVHDTVALVALQLAILAAASCLLAVPDGAQYLSTAGLDFAQVWADLSALPWDELAFMGIGTTAVTLWIEMNSLKEVSAPLAALIYSAEPLWGASLAWIVLQARRSLFYSAGSGAAMHMHALGTCLMSHEIHIALRALCGQLVGTRAGWPGTYSG